MDKLEQGRKLIDLGGAYKDAAIEIAPTQSEIEDEAQGEDK